MSYLKKRCFMGMQIRPKGRGLLLSRALQRSILSLFESDQA